jgi:hypothetical protein
MTLSRRLVLIVLVVALVSLVGVAAVALYLLDIQRPVVWEIAAGYHGWVVLSYDDPSCPALPTVGLYQVIPIPSSGRACTSSSLPPGLRYTRYEYVDAAGNRTELPVTAPGGGGMVWAQSYTPRQPGVPFPREVFFVGLEADLQHSWGSQPRP